MEFHPNLHTRRSPTQSDLYQCHINTIDSPDDEHRGARNMQRIGINIYEKRTVRQVGYLQELPEESLNNLYSMQFSDLYTSASIYHTV